MEQHRKKILLISNEMTYTGAPRSLLELACVLLNHQFDVDVWTYKSGPFVENYIQAGLHPRVVDEYKAFQDPQSIVRECLEYDFVVCNTIMTYAYENVIKKYVPAIWLIHEAYNISEFVEKNVDLALALKQKHVIYVVSEYAQAYLRNVWQCNSRVLHNCIPDVLQQIQSNQSVDNTIHFIAIGVISKRKAYDVLLKAYSGLQKSIRDKSMLHIIGKMTGYEKAYEQEIENRIKETDRVVYEGEIADHQKILEKISQSDAAIVISRDESCSLVAIEAAMLGVPIIVRNCN